MIEQEKHKLKGQRVRIKACHGIHDGVQGKKSEGCVCDFKGIITTLGNHLRLMSNSPDSYRVEFVKEKKLVRLDEVEFLIS